MFRTPSNFQNHSSCIVPGITPCMFPVNVFHLKYYATSHFGYALSQLLPSFQLNFVAQHTMPE